MYVLGLKPEPRTEIVRERVNIIRGSMLADDEDGFGHNGTEVSAKDERHLG